MILTLQKMQQELDIRTGTLTNSILLQLPDGHTICARVDEGAAQIIATCAVIGGTVPTPSTSAPDGAEELGAYGVAAEPDEVHVFGADVPVPATGARAVGKDSLGYPILRGGAGVDLQALSTGAESDEDGVGQV